MYGIHCNYLANVYALPKTIDNHKYFGKAELILLVETSIRNTRCMDNTLQHIILWCMFFYTGGRPSSFLSTAHYKDFYIRFQDVHIVRTAPECFAVDLYIVAWKGGHGLNPWRILAWSPNMMTQPLLCAAAPRGFTLTAKKDHPMTYTGHRVFLKGVAMEAGLSWDGVTAYCIRRGTATTWIVQK
ncbi:hypothetical protein C2E23DRAFT_856902 [Lenzites betulinus]|nr:hypothetical protein C2E23DRAFT_856902 [Lenzites betulinus]